MSGGLTPRGQETLVRLCTGMPFEQARELLQDLVGIQVSKATARRLMLGAGEAQLLMCEGEVERLKQEVPQAPAGADKQVLSADGAFVHLVGGEWAEVKTLLMGEVSRTKRAEVCTQRISSVSRLCEAERFAEAALVETHRRGLERAIQVWAVQDGAEWLQGLVDSHRRDAVRMLDCAHAAEYLSEMGQAVQAAGGRWSQRTKLRQAQSQHRLASALWFLVVWGVRVSRLSHPPGGASPTPTAVESLAKPPTHRPGSG